MDVTVNIVTVRSQIPQIFISQTDKFVEKLPNLLKTQDLLERKLCDWTKVSIE